MISYKRIQFPKVTLCCIASTYILDLVSRPWLLALPAWGQLDMVRCLHALVTVGRCWLCVIIVIHPPKVLLSTQVSLMTTSLIAQIGDVVILLRASLEPSQLSVPLKDSASSWTCWDSIVYYPINPRLRVWVSWCSIGVETLKSSIVFILFMSD